MEDPTTHRLQGDVTQPEEGTAAAFVSAVLASKEQSPLRAWKNISSCRTARENA